jgi:hypothetical protein
MADWTIGLGVLVICARQAARLISVLGLRTRRRDELSVVPLRWCGRSF